eukprot:142010-Chlamydomonas_euryale.AAC.1
MRWRWGWWGRRREAIGWRWGWWGRRREDRSLWRVLEGRACTPRTHGTAGSPRIYLILNGADPAAKLTARARASVRTDGVCEKPHNNSSSSNRHRT